MLTRETIREVRRAVQPLGKAPSGRRKQPQYYGHSDLVRFREILESFRDEAVQELRSLRESAGADLPVSEQTAQLIQRQVRLLTHLDAALRRIKDGTYGVCRSCGERIEPGRLEAVPHTQMCLGCKTL